MRYLLLVILLLFSMSITAQEEAPPIAVPNVPSLSGDVIGHMHAIYAHGQSLGNRPDVFSKVGDSATHSAYFLSPIGEGYTELGDFGYLQGVIDYYGVTRARTNNSFVNQSLATGIGWSAVTLQNSGYRNFNVCNRQEAPLRCEYRITQPSIAFIMLGTNEVTYLSVEDYRTNMQWIIDTSIEMGVIPVLSTIPYRRGAEEKVDAYNNLLRQMAAENRIPLIEYAGVMATLPNQGLDSSRKHPTAVPRNQYRGSAIFTYENLHYGFTMRNLMTLQMLHTIKSVLP